MQKVVYIQRLDSVCKISYKLRISEAEELFVTQASKFHMTSIGDCLPGYVASLDPSWRGTGPHKTILAIGSGNACGKVVQEFTTNAFTAMSM